MRLYAIAYPELGASDLEMIQDFRKDHDRLYSIIDPHFTFVFLVEDFSPEDFCTEIRKQLKGIKTIHFSIRCTTINKDAFSDHYFAFLVPDEGFSAIKKLHDKLYSDKLSHHHRLDIDYIPHIEIANSTDKFAIKKIVDEWNAKDFEMHGKISAVDVIAIENRTARTIERLTLG